MTLGSIVEAILGSLYGVRQPVSKPEKRLHRIWTVVVVLFLVSLVAFYWPKEGAAQRYCHAHPSPHETASECIERLEKIASRLATVAPIDQNSLSSCSSVHKDDLEAIWDCVLLDDGKRLSDSYRKPGEGD
ncbi:MULTISPECIES: hypothetical protein [Hyphomicrobiales]|uniref:hypothetical protein n=1 Tax=Hyphomicrobiales TaxID=356 RepID=UPI00211A78E2|nr:MULTISPECIES: hypothetical protein [Hyphomicrobiales]MCQ9147330.1 hypothetical protein [Ochrobactrum sp. BTU2]MDH1271540.1 hypothetical protein [Agrobacterium pusense]